MARKRKMENTEVGPAIPTRDKMREVASWLYEKKGKDVVAMDVTGLCSIAEGMVLVTAGSIKHAQALGSHILDRAGEAGFEFLGMEGQRTGNWVLLDLNDVVVHIFRNETRSFYNLEGLWSEAEVLDIEPGDAEPDDAEDEDGD